MVYTMKIYVDGGCRRNGQQNPIGAAAVIMKTRYGTKYWSQVQRLPHHEIHTNQPAEILAIIVGLKMALERYDELRSNPRLDLTIHSDSR